MVENVLVMAVAVLVTVVCFVVVVVIVVVAGVTVVSGVEAEMIKIISVSVFVDDEVGIGVLAGELVSLVQQSTD